MYVSAIPVGGGGGHVFMYPLVPLCIHPQLLWLTPWVGLIFQNGVLLLISLALSRSLLLLSGRWQAILLVSVSFFLSGLSVKQGDAPHWVKRVAVIPKIIVFLDPLTASLHVRQLIRTVLKDDPDVDIVVFPEGSFYCSTLCLSQKALGKLSEKHLGKKVHILLGAFHQTDGKLYNTLIHVHNGILNDVFHKRQCLPLTEQIPAYLAYDPIKQAYFNGVASISPSNNQREAFLLSGSLKVVPYICSEIFCNAHPDDKEGTETIVSICNDFWFFYPKRLPYIPDLMVKCAQLKAIAWRRPVLYCSFFKAGYISPSGHLRPINRGK